MAMHERREVIVSTTIVVGDNSFVFQARGVASGGEYRGAPPMHGFIGAELERAVRGCVDTQLAKVATQANKFIADAYPLAHPDHQG